MYLHIGGEKEIFIGKIVCIMNYKSIDNITDIINHTNYEIIDVSGGCADSVILAGDFETGGFTFYLSGISTGTLKNRLSKYI